MSGQCDVSLIRPIVTTAVGSHPERERLERLLSAGVQVQVREMEPHPDKPLPDSVEETEFQAFLRDGDETIPIVSFPGSLLVPPVVGREIGPPNIDVAVLERPIPMVRMAFTWPETPEMPNVDVLLDHDQAEDLSRSLLQASEIVDELLEENDG